MNRHQVLTGAVNSGDNCFSAGSVEGVSFTAYAAGCNIVILASDFTRVQIIPGILHGNVQVSCLDASTDVGKIAVAFGRKIAIFEPTPLLQQSSPHKLDYKWIQTAALDSDCSVSVLSWSLEGNKLLSGGSIIQMWQLVGSPHSSDANEPVIDPDKLWWDCVWRCKTANPTHFLEFSPDGSLFISAGKSDRLVKIWFESAAKNNYLNNHNPVTGATDAQSGNCTLRHAPMSTTHPLSEISYSFVYIAHPRAVTDISWRKTSKYTPRGCCANMLVTSCKDNICRIWVQTLLPDDGMVNFSQIEELATGTIPRTQTQRHRQRLLQRIKEIRSFTQFKKRHHTQNGKKDGAVLEEVNIPIPNLPSTYSVHDFHTFGLHGASMTPGLHFHLAAAINAETDIPLVPSLNTGYDPNTGAEHPTFVMHWLNNKEMTFSRMAERLLHTASLKIFEAEAHKPGSGSSSEAASEAGEVASEPDTKQKHRTPVGSPSKKKSPKLKEGNISKASSFASLREEKDSPVNICDLLDRKFESLLRKWHSTSDVLFSIHPVDGSLLVWLVDWLDETCPGSFRQARVSFNARIPSAIALGDASTMSQKLALYSPYSLLDLRTLSTVATSNASTPMSTEEKDILFKKQKQQITNATQPSPTLYMISKHTNGSLNQWAITFAESSNFTQVLSVAHEKRVCGHRFRVNDISCHPVLPLFLTTSHHNLPGAISSSSFGNNLVPAKSSASSLSSSPSRGNSPDKEESPPKTNSPKASDSSQTYLPNAGFCSELILWKVKSVGPLSKSGGVTELARINSPCISAFSNVAWIPTLLPSHTLGTITNSSSACFIASDGKQLRIYQAIIDATTLLAEITASRKVTAKDISDVSSEEGNSSGGFDDHQQRDLLEDAFKIVSLQSTPRPGCILELTGISEATHDWQNTQLLHVFQDQLIRCDKAYKSWMKRQESSTGLTEPGLDAVVDLRHSAVFEEPFYLVVLEKNEASRSVLHMWKLVISSSSRVDEGGEFTSRKFGTHLDTGHQSSEPSSRSATPDSGQQEHPSVTPLRITTNKVAQEVLPLPEDVEVIHACVAAGHLSSSVIYPACFAPYLICTACSDGVVRFWNCEVSRSNSGNRFKWSEWQMYLSNSPSAIEVPGQPLYVSCAYSGRVAIAYKHGQSFSKPQSDARYININLAIYECESTGGSEWILEDTIKLKNVVIPQSEAGQGIDLQPLIESSMKNRKKADTLSSKMSESRTQSINRLLSVPSYTTMQSLKKIISEQGNQFTLTQKSAVQVDWVSTEDGSHALTVSVGSKISVFTPVSTDIAQANLQAMKASAKAKVSNPSRMLLKQASMGVSTLAPPEDIKWMAIRTTNLSTADGLPPLPMQVSWVRDGILVVGMDNEMHIYSQWKAPVSESTTNEPEAFDLRHLSEADLLTKAKESPQLRFQTPSSKMLTSSESISSSVEDVKTKTHNAGSGSDSVDGSVCHKAASTTDNILAYFGIFEAARLACPVLPQYHPKQLMELLAFGKIHRVRAILRHLAHSLCSMDSMKSHLAQRQANRNSYRSRSQSNSAQSLLDTKSPFDPTDFGEEVQLEYTEITSIRPLPLFTLLDAETEQRPAAASEGPATTSKLKSKTSARTSDLDNESYGGLFDSAFKSTVEETLDEILNKSGFNFDQKPGQTVDDVFASDGFGPKQARLLTKLLTHSHLPGLSSSDQMHLLALADAVASFDSESSEVDGENVVSANSLDECGLRFLLCMRQHTYLLRSLPISQRKQLHKDGIATCNIVWAFHSETQEELVQLIQSTYRTGCRWSHLRELGLGWWIRNNSLLKRLIEQIAKSSFQAKNDPLDAALFYLAMKKKSLVWGLYRSIGDNKMTEFFQHNFSEDKWRKAALKNAYALLGKQRFEHAAAFFLLAGNVWDAVEICLNKLDDVQLAMVVVRLYEGDLETVPENLKRILYQEVLGYDKNGDEYHPNKAHPDPFLRSMAYWILQDYSSSLTTLLESEIGLDHPKNTGNVLTEMKDDIWVHPSVFNFYLHLRTKPLIVRRHFARSLQDKKSDVSLSDAITTFERRLFFITAHQHFRAGCPSLGLEVLSRLPGRIVKDDESILNRCDSVDHTDEIAKGILTTPCVRSDFALPPAPKLAAAAAANRDEFDWGAPVASLAPVDTSFKIDITLGSEGEDDEDEEEDEQNAKSHAKEAICQVKNSTSSALANHEAQLDIMAQQLKFIACLKIIMEELSTLATGNEVENDQLRYQLYLWLEKTVNALKTICSTRAASVKGMNYRSVDQSVGETGSVFGDEVTRSPSDRASGLTPRASYSDSNKGSAGGTAATPAPQILLPDKLDSEAKLEKCRKRKEWLRANEALLRTMLSYCSLHDTHGGGLASVRMELILLLQELQDESSPHQLLSPPPSPRHPSPVPPPLGDQSMEEKQSTHSHGIVRIVHRDHDNISSFCINKNNTGLIAVATPKEIQELNIAPLLEPVTWLDQVPEMDMTNSSAPATDYLVVQLPFDHLSSSPGRTTMQFGVPLTHVSPHTNSPKDTVLVGVTRAFLASLLFRQILFTVYCRLLTRLLTFL